MIMVVGQRDRHLPDLIGPWAVHPATYEAYRGEWTDLTRLVNGFAGRLGRRARDPAGESVL